MMYEVSCASGDMSQYLEQFDFVVTADECGEEIYYLEISSLEELSFFIGRVGRVVMSPTEIIIYDDYME